MQKLYLKNCPYKIMTWIWSCFRFYRSTITGILLIFFRIYLFLTRVSNYSIFFLLLMALSIVLLAPAAAHCPATAALRCCRALVIRTNSKFNCVYYWKNYMYIYIFKWYVCKVLFEKWSCVSKMPDRLKPMWRRQNEGSKPQHVPDFLPKFSKVSHRAKFLRTNEKKKKAPYIVGPPVPAYSYPLPQN